MFKKLSNFLNFSEEKKFFGLFTLPQNPKFLDISCGNGNELRILKKFCPGLRGYGIDLSPTAINRAKHQNRWAQFTVANAEHLPFAEHTLDCVFSGMTWHHYPKPELILTEAYRVLKPLGQLLIVDLMPLTKLSQWFLNQDKCPEKYFFKQYYQPREIINLGTVAHFTFQRQTTLSWLNGIRCLTFTKLSSH
jgi:ubiquinone/menaquinone biosynthesis C-methylase UbiE